MVDTRDEERPSAAIQDYLKAIYAVAERSGRDRASTSQVAVCLGVSPASASGMLKRLSELGYVTPLGRGGAQLTERGRLAALEVIRHHRLLETFLVEALGMSWDSVHAEAEVLEHHISTEVASRIAAALGDPRYDPHGHPIPTAQGEVAPLPAASLIDLPDGARARVSGVNDRDGELLRFLASLGILPGAIVDAVTRAPYEGPISVRVDEREPIDVPIGAARHVLVDEVAAPPRRAA